VIIDLLLIFLNVLSWGYYFRRPVVMLSPIVETTPTPTVSPSSTPSRSVHTGIASFYSWAGCVGCNENRIMANRQPLDDTRLTVAYNRAPLNSFVNVKCKKTGRMVRAKVTDWGGFERLGRIIDLSVTTKNAIGCGGLCIVEVEKI